VLLERTPDVNGDPYKFESLLRSECPFGGRALARSFVERNHDVFEQWDEEMRQWRAKG